MDAEFKILLDKQDWGSIIKELTLHAYSRFKFWNLLGDKRIKGYSPAEIAYEAIEKIYDGTWKWDPLRSDILTYLKFHVVNGLVANLARNKEVALSSKKEIEKIQVIDSFSHEEEFNAQQVIELISEDLKNDELAQGIFDGLCDGLHRKDICETLGISKGIYDNGVRRLRSRILKMNKLNVLK